jgi:hypothetical protein
MTTNEMPGPSGTHPDRYLEDISADELSANAPADETHANKNARRERNQRRNEWCRRLHESLPIRNLVEAIDQVENRVHSTSEQCLMSITMIARHAQGMRAGEVIAKLAEDAYFMRVDNRVAQVPPVRNRQPDNEATSHSPADNGRNCTRGELPVNPNRTRASAGEPSHGGNSAGGAGGNCDIVPHRDPGGGGSDSGSTSHGAGRRAGGGGDRGGRGHANSHAFGVSRGSFDARQRTKNYDAKSPPRQATTMASPPSPHGFAIYFSRRHSNHWGSPSTTRSKTQYSGSDVTPSPSKTLVAIMTQSVSTFPSTWIKPRLHGPSQLRSTRSTSGTSSRTSSPATSRALWVAQVLAWTWQW